MTRDLTVTARMRRDIFDLSIGFEGDLGRTQRVRCDPGPIRGDTCDGPYRFDTSVTLTALPADDHEFVRWGGDCSGSSPTCRITMSRDRRVTARFRIITYDLELDIEIDGSGVSAGVRCNPGGVGRNGCETYEAGTNVTLTAIEDGSSRFVSWGGDCSGRQITCRLTMSRDRRVVANFEAATQTLQVQRNGRGRVRSRPGGIACGNDCRHDFDHDTQVTLTADPDDGFRFTGWDGACDGTGDCRVRMDRDRNVTATFEPVPRRLRVQREGSGRVRSRPNGIDCGSDCEHNYNDGTQVTLTADPADNFRFAGWDGACDGTGECRVRMDRDRNVTATFVPIPRTLQVRREGSGRVRSRPDGIDCGNDCRHDYNDGTQVTLTANPADGFQFAGWDDDCDGTGDCRLRMDRDRNVTARFVQQFRLTVSRDGSGRVQSSPSGINCGDDCNHVYDNGTQVTLTANAADGFQFAGWAGACSGSGDCRLSMDRDRSVTARFIQQFQLTVTRDGGGRVQSSPSGISCGDDCSHIYNDGTQVALTATADDGFMFDGWGGACNGTGDCRVTMSANRSVTATFVQELPINDVIAGLQASIKNLAFVVEGQSNNLPRPSLSPGGPNATADSLSGATSGGTLLLAVLGDQNFSSLIIDVPGWIGFYEVTLPYPVRGALVLVTLQQQLPDNFDLVIALGDSNGRYGTPARLSVPTTTVATGQVQISLSWDTSADLDLYVTAPSGIDISIENPHPKDSPALLDLDSGSACVADLRSENVSWPSHTAPEGEYTVWISPFNSCGAPEVDFTVTVWVRGQAPRVVKGSLTPEVLSREGAGLIEVMRFQVP